MQKASSFGLASGEVNSNTGEGSIDLGDSLSSILGAQCGDSQVRPESESSICVPPEDHPRPAFIFTTSTPVVLARPKRTHTS